MTKALPPFDQTDFDNGAFPTDLPPAIVAPSGFINITGTWGNDTIYGTG